MNNIEEELLELIEEGKELHYKRYSFDASMEDHVYNPEASKAYSSWERRVKMFAERNLSDHPLYEDLLRDINAFVATDSDSICDILTDIYNDLIKHNEQ